MINWGSKSKLGIIAVISILLLFFLHFVKVLTPIENVIVGATKSIFSAGYSASNYINSNYLEFQTKSDLIKDNEKLRSEIVQLLSEKSSWQEEKEENQFLREQLNFVSDNPTEYEVASVVGKSIDKLQNTLIIDKGEKHGIAVGQPVLTSSGLLIGKIIQVKKNRAFVLLINDDFCNVAAKIHNQDRTMGIVEGEFGLGMKMKLIPQTETVSEGDIVVTSGLEDGVPIGLVIGQVESVFKQPEELFQEATISSFVDLNKITVVNIIKSIILDESH